jgi:DNA modification methylase
VSVRIINADVMDGLAQLPDESVHCVVTSPPYWGLRDYGVAGQLGLEPTLGEHVEAMVRVFREVRRVLRKDGTLWLNYGDCYVTSRPGNMGGDRCGKSGNKGNTAGDTGIRVTTDGLQSKEFNSAAGSDGLYSRKQEMQVGHGESLDAIWGSKHKTGLKNKDLCGVPWRLALALQDDGWWLRQDIIWSKPNPMPESIKDRCTKAHEYLFLLAKSERYYFDADAIAEPAVYVGVAGQDANGFKNPLRFEGKLAKSDKQSGHGRRHAGFNKRWDDAEARGECSETRNKRSVWEIATQPFPEAHFATFPPALIEPCIKAGCPLNGTVLDPFGGSGTTGLVADRLKRNAILIELNPEYAAMAEKRIRGDCPMFAEVGV